MKCELCHKNKAETALTVQMQGKEVELYVCKKCAAAEEAKNAAKDGESKVCNLPNGVQLTMSNITPNAGQDPNADAISAQLMSAIDALFDHVSDSIKKGMPIEEALAKVPQELAPKGSMNSLNNIARQQGQHFHLGEDIPDAYVVKDCLHLEGLYQSLELDDVLKACRKNGVTLVPYEIENFDAAGHVFEVRYTCNRENVLEIVIGVCTRESRARNRVLKDAPRLFTDTVCRALAILKTCRLLGRGEFFDLLSPLRVAALQEMLNNITAKKVTDLMERIDLTSDGIGFTVEDYNQEDAARADDVNEWFKDVELNDLGKKFLK